MRAVRCLQVLNPALVLIMIPLVDQFIYPFVERMGVSLHFIRRMVLGMLMNAAAFVVAAILQLAIYRAARTEAEVPGSGRISILWQIPQYVLITAGEVLFSITGLAFAYSEAPASMKAAVQSAWELTVAGGTIPVVRPCRGGCCLVDRLILLHGKLVCLSQFALDELQATW